MTQPFNVPDAQRRQLLGALLPQIAFEGWSDKALRAACDISGIDAGLLSLLFPAGAVDAIAFHSREMDTKVAAQLRDNAAFTALPLPQKIRAAVLKRFELTAAEKIAVSKGLSVLALPQNAALALQLLHDTSDSIWQLAGDTSTDFNWYTKRLTLSGIYSATLLYWLSDDSDNLDKTAQFLDRRLAGLKSFGKFKQNLSKRFQSFIPNLNKLRG